MLKYTGSFPVTMMADPQWQTAFAQSALKRVELSTGGTPDEEFTEKLVRDLLPMQEAGILKAESLHLPFYPFAGINPSVFDEEVRRHTVQHFTGYIRRFRALQIPHITIHCSGEPNETDPAQRRKRMEQMRRSCEEILPLMQELHCSLNLELLPRTCIGNTVEELLAMVDGFPKEHIGILLDVNHGMDRGAAVPEMIRMCGERLTALHISDYDNVNECHWNVGEGMLDWVAIQRELKAMPQDLTVIIEVNHPALPAGRDYKIDPAYSIRNIERNCMKLEYAPEMQEYLDRIRKNDFNG